MIVEIMMVYVCMCALPLCTPYTNHVGVNVLHIKALKMRKKPNIPQADGITIQTWTKITGMWTTCIYYLYILYVFVVEYNKCGAVYKDRNMNISVVYVHTYLYAAYIVLADIIYIEKNHKCWNTTEDRSVSELLKYIHVL